MPLVSVILPNYNYGRYLEQRIESILNQTFQDFSLIILDDASEDDSLKIIHRYRSHPKVKYVIVNDLNTGSPFKQWQKGIELSEEEIIWIAEADDYCTNDFLSKLLLVLRRDKEIALAYCQSYQVNSDGQVTGDWKSYTDNLDPNLFTSDFTMSGSDYICKFLIHKNTIPNASGVIFRKKYLEMVGGLETNIQFCGDWITWLKILLFGKVFFRASCLNYFRYHSESVIAKASEKYNQNVYVGKYDGVMRRRLQDYLEQYHIEKTDIIQSNHQYLQKDKIEERYFFEMMTKNQSS